MSIGSDVDLNDCAAIGRELFPGSGKPRLLESVCAVWLSLARSRLPSLGRAQRHVDSGIDRVRRGHHLFTGKPHIEALRCGALIHPSPSQEVDRLDHMLPHLPHHKAIRASGPGKLHGLVILYNTQKFTFKATRTIQYDEEFTRGDYHAERRLVDLSKETEAEIQERRKRWKKARGGTRQTKNIGLMVALEWAGRPGEGIVVGTTHL